MREPRQVSEGMRWCPDCGEARPEADFPRHAGTTSGFGVYCRVHHNERCRASREKVHGGSRHYHLVRRYGVSAAEVDEMVERQAGLCPICLRVLDKRAHVDHDHLTGVVRAVLCFTCNAGLGNYGDDSELLRRAADYLDGRLLAPSPEAPGVIRVESDAWRRSA